ncbi:MAG: S49 family peptidase [Gemmatimonadales bacterium]|nr:MAG: S49 family peptidase [Gemmatimonadales bacterium]
MESRLLPGTLLPGTLPPGTLLPGMRLPGILLLGMLLLVVPPLWGQEEESGGLGFLPWQERTAFLMSSPGSLRFGLYGFANPALLATLHEPDLLFQWSDRNGFGEFDDWALFAAVPNLGFGVMERKVAGERIRDHRLALGFGSGEASSFGVAYGWYGGDADLDSQVTLGALLRPSPFLSIGLTGTRSFGSADYEGVLDLGLRPLGTERIALSGELPVNSVDRFSRIPWAAGAVVEPVAGIRVAARYVDDVGFSTGLEVSLGTGGLRSQVHLDTGGSHRFNTYGVRLGAYDRNLRDTHFPRRDTYLQLRIRGSLPHQRARFLDSGKTLQETLDALEVARRNPRIAGVVIDARGIGLSQGRAWEVGAALGALRREGRKVVLYVERGGMNVLHLVAEADRVVMDPRGSLTIPGYLIGRTYLAELLEDVGIGVDEFREMEYKSAFETFSRTGMSEAEREQSRRLVDGFYDLVRGNVTQGRELEEGAFDALIREGILLPAAELRETGLVDTLARPQELDGILEELEGWKPRRIGPQDLLPHREPRDDRWGPLPKIGLLYAIGPTLTGTGIRARELAEEIRSLRARDDVKALVLRVDSPGGDALAADLVAEELRKTAEEIPVVVSMGDLAASGGYWISMYADTIVALPISVTGSIGVIGGWFWDAGLGDRLRLHVDGVQRGPSADARFGPALPLIGLGLPGRNLTEEERNRLVGNLNRLYDEFVEKVAEGRGMDPAEVREVAEGRVWTGEDALDAGLVDELGNLTATLRIAREAAGIPEGERFAILEGPESPLLDFPPFLPRLGVERLGVEQPPEPDLLQTYLEMILERGGEPLPLLPFEYVHWHHRMGEGG